MTATKQQPIGYIRDEIPSVQVPAYSGERYPALVPDTLDLQDRAALGVNGLTGPTDPDADYEMYVWAFFKHNPPMLQHDWSDQCQCKFMESLPLMRLMSGSELNLHVEQRWLEVILRMQGPDGLLYYPTVGRPWARLNDTWGSADADQFAIPFHCGRMLGALTLYHLLDGGGVWREATERLVDGLAAYAVYRDDYAFLPKGAIVPGRYPAADAEMPTGIWASAQSGWVLQGLAQAGKHLEYEPALELAGRLARYLKDHSRYYDDDGSFSPGRPERGPRAHFHHHLYPQLAMLDYGLVAGDQPMIDFAHKGFQYGVANGNTLIGYFPENLNSAELEHSEICEVADMIAMALKLTEAGVGDYWDEVERWTRNMLAEGQMTQCDWIDRVSAAGYPDGQAPVSAIDQTYQTTDRAAERSLGAFAGWPMANDWYAGVRTGIMHCCTGNGTRALYYVWENILHHDDGRLRVNLLLNRASPWADVDSHMPYVGQVDIRVKAPVDLSVRIPQWATADEVRTQVNGTDRTIDWRGRYAELGAVRPGDVATITFPLPERTETVWIEKERYTLVLKGYDVVAIDPPGRYCPLYQRAHYRPNRTRWVERERFVTHRDVSW